MLPDRPPPPSPSVRPPVLIETPLVPPAPIEPLELFDTRSLELPESVPVLIRPPSKLAELAGDVTINARTIPAAAYPLNLFNLLSLYWAATRPCREMKRPPHLKTS